jgi:hypothetical protein
MSESMTEDTGASVEVIGGAAKPSLSQDTISYQQSLLADPAFVRDHPQHAAMLRATLDEALAATGQNQPPPGDPRSAAQRLHDQQRGVVYGASGETMLPSHLSEVVKHDAAGTAPDPEKVAAYLVRAGLNVKTVLADAKFAIEKSGQGVKAEQLSAHALAQLAVWGAHLRAHAKTRPQ